jgi:hypothetical protein
MVLIRTPRRASFNSSDSAPDGVVPLIDNVVPALVPTVATLEQVVRSWYAEGRSQRSIGRDLNINRRKVKQIIDRDTADR